MPRVLTPRDATQKGKAVAASLGYKRNGRSRSAVSTGTVQGFAIGMAIHGLVASGR